MTPLRPVTDTSVKGIPPIQNTEKDYLELQCEKLVATLEEVQKMMERLQWVSVKYRVPSDDNLVLDLCDCGYSLVFYYGPHKVMKEGFWFLSEDGYAVPHTKITHWMPLPDAPKENE